MDSEYLNIQTAELAPYYQTIQDQLKSSGRARVKRENRLNRKNLAEYLAFFLQMIQASEGTFHKDRLQSVLSYFDQLECVLVFQATPDLELIAQLIQFWDQLDSEKLNSIDFSSEILSRLIQFTISMIRNHEFKAKEMQGMPVNRACIDLILSIFSQATSARNHQKRHKKTNQYWSNLELILRLIADLPLRQSLSFRPELDQLTIPFSRRWRGPSRSVHLLRIFLLTEISKVASSK